MGGGGLKGKKWPKLKNNDYIPHTPYLRSSIAYDLDFWYTCIKWWRKKFCLSRFIFQEPYIIWLSFMVDIWKMVMSLAFFLSIFSKFWFSGLFGGKKKIVENDKKNCILCFMSQEPYIIWSSFVVHKCKMIISPQFFFHFFKMLIFWVARRVKCKKMAQNDKKFCFPCLVLQEPYIIWSSLMPHMCKRIISPGVFLHFFQILFLG